MLEFIYKNMEYPAAAKKASIEGMTVIQFIVEKDGNLIERIISVAQPTLLLLPPKVASDQNLLQFLTTPTVPPPQQQQQSRRLMMLSK